MNPKVLVLYHYYHPDDVVSAAHFTGLCEGLAGRGFEVEVWPGNRACHDKDTYSTKSETINGVMVKRVWRPPLSQHSFLGRILNSVWMQKRWWWRLVLSPSYKPDLILIGTDPLLALISAPFLKWLRPDAKMIHWCFDLYPEAAIADGLAGEGNLLVKAIWWFMRRGYQKCSLLVDLGPCMRDRLSKDGVLNSVTITPWALNEPVEPMPVDKEEREELFGEASLALLYSGNLGRAHEFYLTLKLSHGMKKDGAIFCYAARGGRMDALRKAHNPEYTNVRFGAFAPEDKLEARLAAPDIHIVSLRTGWTGVVVPSKFFGALAVGRPVLFEGDEHCSIARWIKEYGVGWVLNHDNLEAIRQDLLKFSKSPKQKTEMFRRCHQVYQTHFSKKSALDAWDRELQKFSH